MGLAAWTVGLPLLPMRGVIWLGEIIEQRVKHELQDPSVARHQLEEADEAARQGDISPETQADIEREVTGRLTTASAVGNSTKPGV